MIRLRRDHVLFDHELERVGGPLERAVGPHAIRADARGELEAFLGNLTYLRASRVGPSRAYKRGQGRYQPIGYSGEWFATLLLEKKHEAVNYQLPSVVPDSMEEAMRGDFDWRETQTALMNAMKGYTWESPRGPISIDPATREIVQNVYVRKVERANGQLYNVEFQTIPSVKDPGKTAK